MAGNTIRPVVGGPPRANTVRPRPEEVAAVPAAPTPVVAVAEPPPLPAPEPVAPRPRKPAAPTPLTAAEAEAQASEWRTQAAGSRSAWSLFSLLDRFTGLDGLFREGLPVRYLPKLLFVMLLTLIYIGNTHYGNRMNRNIQRLKQETEDLRADYTTLKSDYMEASKQSEVARKVAAIGLVESSSPPFRIAVPAGHLDEAELETMPVLTADTLAARAARDSVASVRADSIKGQAHRQQLDSSADDSDAELGPPPPGPTEDEAASVVGDKSAKDKGLPRKERKRTADKKKAVSTKKSIKAQVVPAAMKGRSKKPASSNPKQ